MVAVTSASPKAVVMASRLLLALSVDEVCKFDLGHVSEVRG